MKSCRIRLGTLFLRRLAGEWSRLAKGQRAALEAAALLIVYSPGGAFVNHCVPAQNPVLSDNRPDAARRPASSMLRKLSWSGNSKTRDDRTYRVYPRSLKQEIDVAPRPAIDVHVHLEAVNEATATDAAAKKYFGESGASRDPKALAEYYRSRKMAFVIFAVDEKLTGRPRVTNEEVIRFAADNADVAIPFASIDPHRGPEGVREAKRLVADGSVRGL